MLQIGKIYWAKFPGVAARVIKAPMGLAPLSHPNLVESLFLHSRWYVNDQGEPTHSHCPRLIISPTVQRSLDQRTV
jgi:hypothetical protein